MRVVEKDTEIEVELNKETIETYYCEKNIIYITTVSGQKYRYLDDSFQFVRDLNESDNNSYRI